LPEGLVSAPTRRLVAKMMAPEPSRRHLSPAAALEDLLGVIARVTSPRRRTLRRFPGLGALFSGFLRKHS
jgi:hypothetical protein